MKIESRHDVNFVGCLCMGIRIIALLFVRGIHRWIFDAYFIFSLKKLLEEQSYGRWVEMPWPSNDQSNDDKLIQEYQWPLLLTWFNFNPSMDK